MLFYAIYIKIGNEVKNQITVTGKHLIESILIFLNIFIS